MDHVGDGLDGALVDYVAEIQLPQRACSGTDGGGEEAHEPRGQVTDQRLKRGMAGKDVAVQALQVLLRYCIPVRTVKPYLLNGPPPASSLPRPLQRRDEPAEIAVAHRLLVPFIVRRSNEQTLNRWLAGLLEVIRCVPEGEMQMVEFS